MTDTEKISELLLDSAWKSLEFIQQRIDKMEDKANNLMAFSGVLLSINVALIIEAMGSVFITILLFIESLLLIKCVWYAYCTIKLRKQNVLDLVGTLRKLDLTDHIQSTGDLALTITNRQQELLNLADDKSSYLKISMRWFTSALGFLVVIIIAYVLLALVPYFLTLVQQLYPSL